MPSVNTNTGDRGSNLVGCEKALLTARPHIRFLRLSFLAPMVLLVAGVMVYLLPLTVDRDFRLAAAAFIIGIGLVGMACLRALYECLSGAEYRLTAGHIEEESGIINKRLRRIPLSYVRDVTFDQNLFQRVFGIVSLSLNEWRQNRAF